MSPVEKVLLVIGILWLLLLIGLGLFLWTYKRDEDAVDANK